MNVKRNKIKKKDKRKEVGGRTRSGGIGDGGGRVLGEFALDANFFGRAF